MKYSQVMTGEVYDQAVKAKNKRVLLSLLNDDNEFVWKRSDRNLSKVDSIRFDFLAGVYKSEQVQLISSTFSCSDLN